MVIKEMSKESQLNALLADLAHEIKTFVRPRGEPACRCHAHPCPHDTVLPMDPLPPVTSDPFAAVPTCDICNEPESVRADHWGDDWNGDTGCHRSCEDAMV